jgi:hypothetical protein
VKPWGEAAEELQNADTNPYTTLLIWSSGEPGYDKLTQLHKVRAVSVSEGVIWVTYLDPERPADLVPLRNVRRVGWAKEEDE